MTITEFKTAQNHESLPGSKSQEPWQSQNCPEYVCKNCVDTFFNFFLNIYLSKLQFSPGNLFEKLRKKSGNILSLDEIGKILLNVSTL